MASWGITPTENGAHDNCTARWTRIFALSDLARARTENTREYLTQLSALRDDLRPELRELTHLFEEARYGTNPPDTIRLEAMRKLYRLIYQQAW